MLEGEYDYTRPTRGQVCYADVLSVGENQVIVDLGCTRDGVKFQLEHAPKGPRAVDVVMV